MWNNKTVAIIFPGLKQNSIRNIVTEFDSTGYVDEIIIVQTSPTPKIISEIKKTRAKLIKHSPDNINDAIKTGIKSTSADLLIISSPTGAFRGKDLVKFLSYGDDFDMVFGSRTHVPLIQKRTEMTFLKRIVDVFLGKLISLLFICPPLTDISCDYILTNRKAWSKILRESQSSHFALEWLLIAAKNQIKFIQIPINFGANSTHKSNEIVSKAILSGFLNLYSILKFWLESLIQKSTNSPSLFSSKGIKHT